MMERTKLLLYTLVAFLTALEFVVRMPKTKNINYYSYVVMPSYQAFQLTVYIEQIFGYDNIAICTKYPEDTMMSTQNYIGVMDDIDDKEWIKNLEKKPHRL